MTLKESKDLHNYLKSMTSIHPLPHDRTHNTFSNENSKVILQSQLVDIT